MTRLYVALIALCYIAVAMSDLSPPISTFTKLDWDENLLVYVTKDIVLITDAKDALYRSTNGGQSWIQNTNLPGISQIILNPFDSTSIICVANPDKTGDTNLYISSDSATSFNLVTVKGKMLQNFQVNSNPNGKGYIMASVGVYSLFYSKDFGKTWTGIYTNTQVKGAVWDPVTSTTNGIGMFAVIQTKGAMKLVYSPDLGETRTELIDGAQTMEVTSKYLYVGAYDPKLGGSNLWVRSTDTPYSNDKMGFHMCDFPFGDDIQPREYTIIDDTTGAIWLGIQMDTTKNWGTVYTSNSYGNMFTQSIDHVSLKRAYDFTPFYSMGGAYVVNNVTNPNAGKDKPTNVQSVISYDNGGEWSKFTPPPGNSNCKGCSLNVHGISTYLNSNKQYGPFYTTSNVIGTALTTGTISNALSSDAPIKNIKTFLTRDVGKSWTQVYDSPSIYEFANYGSVMVLANATDTTDTIRYSFDQGTSWEDFKFNNDANTAYDIKNIVTDPNTASLKLMLLAYEVNSKTGAIFGLDFSASGLSACVDSDFESFTTPKILGQVLTYDRVKTSSKCYQTDEPTPTTSVNQPCTVDDYECDIGYTEVSVDDTTLICALDADWVQPSDPPANCPSGSTYQVTKGFRKIASDFCVDGQSSTYDPITKNCPGGPGSKSHGWVAALIIFLILAIAVGGGGFYLYKNPDAKEKVLKKLGFSKEPKYSSLGFKPNSLADDEFGIEDDDDAQILNDNDQYDKEHQDKEKTSRYSTFEESGYHFWVGGGVVYVDYNNSGISFGRVLGQAFNFQFDYLPLNGDQSRDYLVQVQPFIEEAAREYKAKHNRPPVLVIDNIDLLFEKDKKMVESLQFFAKMHADLSDLIVVFVTGNGDVLEFMRSQSSYSHGNCPLVIGDVSDEAAVDYLVVKRNVNKDLAQELVNDITGGHILSLVHAASMVAQGMEYPAIKSIFMDCVLDEFRLAHFNLMEHKDLLKELLNNKVVDGRLEMDGKEIKKILSKNIFHHSFYGQKISFQSRAEETYVRDKLKEELNGTNRRWY
eukprot:gene12493-14664_t